MNKYTVIIPNRFKDVIQPLLRSLNIYEQGLSDIVIVADNHSRNYGYNIVKTNDKFIFSKSANLGINFGLSSDIVLLNDDVRLIQSKTFDTLRNFAYSDPKIGILSPLVYGGCGNVYMRSNREDLWKDNISGLHYCRGLRGPDRVTFTCVYIKRELINDIGLMDENFVGYGFDDADYCIRTIKAGWKLAITNKVIVQHGNGGNRFVRGDNWNLSFMRNRVGGALSNLRYLMSKHSDIFEDNSKFKRT